MRTLRTIEATRAAAAGIALTAAAWLVACGPSGVGNAASVSPAELLALQEAGDAPLLLDVRSVEEFRSGHVPGAVNIPHTELAARLGEIDADDAGIVVYCERGGRAAQATDVLQRAGFRDVGHLEGDMSGWRADGLPVER
ncbi:MAG: rhodanese-like domain-containing protein [Myxococcales bacterium]|nr:rhodanese-like domain-containing protein [Myxococcales bacterium]